MFSKLWRKAVHFVDDKSFELGMAVLVALFVWGIFPKEVAPKKATDVAPSMTEIEWISDDIKALKVDFNFFYIYYSSIAGKKNVSCISKGYMSELDSSVQVRDILISRYSNLCNIFGVIEEQANINARRLISGDIPDAGELHHFTHLKNETESRIGPFFSLPECQYYQDLLARVGEKVIVCRPYNIWMQDLLLPTA
ncbi:hypothetical protein [Halomonas sp. BC04]|uniref:hypothetical protein n=1 Tax=Halomonas sp. BC04 TaxID=1403540 RepID=UPI0012DCE396|nr:hypothetical protein [Halomonas sp. BC04]